MTSVDVLVVDELADLVDRSRFREMERRIADEISELLVRLGILGGARASVRTGGHSRAVQISVGGALLPYPPSLLTRVWHTAAPYELHGAVLDSASAKKGFKDGWLRSLPGSPEAEPIRDAFGHFLPDLVIAAIREQPACLLSDDRIASRAAAFRLRPSSRRAVDVDFPGLARLLVSAGISLADRDRVLAAIDEALVVDLPPNDRWEIVAERLRAPRVEIRVHPKCLASLVATRRRSVPVYDDDVAESLHEPFTDLEHEVFRQRGLRLPQLVWVADGNLDAHVVEVVVNDLPSLPTRIPEPDQLLAGVAAAFLPSSIEGKGTYTPATAEPATLVPAADGNELEKLGVPLQTSIRGIANVVHDELIRRAPVLLAIGDVTYQLSALSTAFPNLVNAALAAYSLGDLTRVLRGLLDEGLSVRDLRFLLDRLLDFEAVVVEDPTAIVLDRRIATTASQPVDPDVITLLAFVRTGLADDLAFRYADEHGRLDALVLDTELDRRASEIGLERNGSGLDEETARELRDAVWSRLPADGVHRAPVLIASTYARRVLRDSLASELPDFGVLAYSEIKPSLKVKRIATIAV